MSLPFLVPFQSDLSDFTPVVPGFPDWERSFVSGSGSTLFKTTHLVSNSDANLLASRVSFLPHAEGPPGHVHGGATAAILDETMGVLVWNQNLPSVTRSLQLRYHRAIPLSLRAQVLCRILQVLDQTIEVHATVYDENGKAYVTAEGLFHRLSESQFARFQG